MKYCYLFEIKSIQSYLFRSGKLKDVIAASERLGALIDSDNTSVLARVLDSAQIESDLLDPSRPNAPGLVRFLRCKGGAFYSYCDSMEVLLELRSVWTLTIQQLFPSLVFIDALAEGERIQESLSSAHQILHAEKNCPDVSLPIATPIVERDQRTGFLSVPISPLAKKSTHLDETTQNAIDVDIELHRQAYSSWNLNDASALQDRFTPMALRGQLAYPIDLENEFQFSASHAQSENKDVIKDIALIHIDGNGLGALLIALKDALANSGDEDYRRGFRSFSEALATATEAAAQSATQWLSSVAAYVHKGSSKKMLPMRPLVLGGDDLTLLCRADLALEYSKHFCLEFRKQSEETLKPLFNRELSASALAPYLTASGGVLFHKAGHPFVNTHHLVEDLCQHAKGLSKRAAKGRAAVPSSLAFYRINKATASGFDELLALANTFEVIHEGTPKSIRLGLNAFFIEDDPELKPNLSALQAIAAQSRDTGALVSMSKWRQMATHIAYGDLDEAQRIYHRAVNRSNNKSSTACIAQSISRCVSASEIDGWYWKESPSSLQCLISDVLTVDHFRPVIESKEDQP